MKKYRVYKIAESKKSREAQGIWQGIKDNIAFSYYETLTEALSTARILLQKTTEKCIAVEDIKNYRLYLVNREHTEVLKHCETADTPATRRIFKKWHKDYTIEKTDKGIVYFAYSKKNERGNISLQAVYSIIIAGAVIFALIIGHSVYNTAQKITAKRSADITELLK